MHRNSRIVPWLLLALLQLFSGASSHATITVVSYWRMGENDLGAAPGVKATNIIDSAGNNNLTVQGAAQYANDVAPSAANSTGSSLSVNFTNGAYARRAIVSTSVDNFGVECWVKPTALGGSQMIVYNGATGGAGYGGWGLFIDSDNTYNVLFGGVTGFGGVPATANVWTHLALVRASGNSTLYVNGAAAATAPDGPVGPSGNFALGAPPQSPTSQNFTGLMDEVRVFTFADGQFSTNDLLWNQSGGAVSLTTQPATAITPTSAQLNGSLNPNGVDSTAWFQYGTTTNYGSVTPPIFVSGTNSAAVSISNVVGGLNPGTTYHFSLVGSNATSSIFGADLAFTTVGPPAISGQSASSIGPNSAMLNAMVTTAGADTTVWFQYGPTTNYGNSTGSTTISGTNTAAVPVSNLVSQLTPGTVYHFQLIATNVVGTSYGGDMTFSTLDFVQSNTPLPGVFNGVTTAWGDFDNDGLMDILLSGESSSGVPITQVLRNTGNGFTDINAGLPGIFEGSAAWGDFDNDGRLDILLSGELNGGATITQVWRNTGNGFSNINAGLPGVYLSSVAWGDFDNDGRPDILLCGYNTDTRLPITQVWRNTGNGFTNINAGLPGVYSGSVAWGDFDNDGRLDILLCGNNGSSPITQVWRNTGNGFSYFAGLPGVYQGAAVWGDFDNDGLLDVLLSGYEGSGFPDVTEVWRNTGNGFTSYAGMSGVGYSSVACGDFDNDGQLDILLCGYTASGPHTEVWRNTGSGFNNFNVGLPGVYLGSVAWGDCNNDGRLDILMAGAANQSLSTRITQLWLNQTSLSNSPPTVPAGLSAAISGSSLTLSWNPSSDLQTPVSGLSYNLRVGTSPGGSDILSPMATGNGMRLVPQRGSIQSTQLTLQLPSVPTPWTTFYWSVQSIDTSFAGSPFAPEASLVVRPFFTSSGRVSDGTFEAQFDVQSGTNYTIQASTDLVHWVNLSNFTSGSSGPFLFTDPDTTNYPHRFYRFGQH